MSNNIDLLTICLEDSLFAALYDALCNLETKWHTSSPVDMWIEALSARQKLSKQTARLVATTVVRWFESQRGCCRKSYTYVDTVQ